QPNGTPLTAYRHGTGPHNGIHLIIVRRDLSVIIHHHPPVGPGGRLTDTVTFPAPGPYRVVIDAYPKNAGPVPSFQLFQTITVKGTYRPQPLPPSRASDIVDGYHFTLRGTPHLHAVQAALLNFTVTDPNGKPVTFTPWFGALAHAIFFRNGSLDYFHTHVCAPGASGCSSVLGGARVTGTSATPGHLNVGVLLPVAGTWRLFLQCRLNGKVVTAPYTLHVSSRSRHCWPSPLPWRRCRPRARTATRPATTCSASRSSFLTTRSSRRHSRSRSRRSSATRTRPASRSGSP
ncbi:MAG TPA: hypothetical protein VFU51_05110, partial [Gaiellaceae bacterium]|nr:hypothetical protein [Gaiellaceae bacterium]